jgi:hypothetical protein
MIGSPQLFTLYRFVSRTYFHLTILFVYLMQRPMPLPAVEIVLACYGAALAVAPLVTRRLAGVLSLSRTLSVGETAKAVGLAVLALPAGVVVAVVAQVVIALGFAMASGTDSVVLAELCRAEGEDAKEWEARSSSWTFVAALCAGFVGVVLYPLWHPLPLLLSAVMSGSAALVGVLLGRRLSAVAVEASAARPTMTPGADGVLDRETGSRVLRWSLYYALTRGFVLALFVGVLPYLLYVRIGVPLAVFGVVLGSFTLAGYLTARYNRAVVGRFGPWLTAVCSVAAVGVAIALLVLLPTAVGAILGTIAMGAAIGYVRPVTVGAIGDALTGRGAGERAAALRANESRFAVLNTLLMLLAALSFGLHLPLGTLLTTLLVAYVVLGIAAVAALPRPRRTAATVISA